MRPALPWLCQGDIFELVPQIVVMVGSADRLHVEQDVGASLLITHDCDLDKPVSWREPARPRIERLQFLPLRDIRVLDPQRQDLVRSRRLNPPEPIYVGGPVPGVGAEAFGLLSELYYLPAAYFKPVLKQHSHPEADPGSYHLSATAHAGRVGRADEDLVDLLRRKIAAFWPRFEVQLDQGVDRGH